MSNLKVEVDLASVSCGECGGTYAIAERYRRKAEEEGTSWTCPYCKVGWGYRNAGTNEKLKKQLVASQAAHDQTAARLKNSRKETEHEAARARGFKGAHAKLKKRVGSGVCPCCKRTFKQLARHMEDNHPEWAGKEGS